MTRNASKPSEERRIMNTDDSKHGDATQTSSQAEPTRAELEAFIGRAGFSWGWSELESWARRMAEQAVRELKEKDTYIAQTGGARPSAMRLDETRMSAEQRTELLDWVSACQSAYHIESTPGHRFGGIPGNLAENRENLVQYVEQIVQEQLARRLAEMKP